MAINSLKRFISSSFRLNSPAFSFNTRITLSSVADKYCAHLLTHPQNPEKSLVRIHAKLDAPCVKQVLHRFSAEKPELGLRFFIWAGLQSKYMHSQYMYGLACDVLQIRRNPGRLREIIEVYRAEGCVTSVKLFKVVLNLCREARIADDALWVLRRMEEFGCRPDSTIYNVVIGLFCQKGDFDMAGGLMREMDRSGLFPDMVTYMLMLKGLCDAGRCEEARLLLKTMKSHGCVVNLVVYSALLDGLCRFGTFENALELLGDMEKEGGDCVPNVITYTSVIQSLCEKGKSMEALPILSRMEIANCAPNRVTISVLVNGLCAEGCIDEAHKLVARVVAEGLVSSGDCYSSLVIGLLKIRRLEEALKLFRWMLSSDMRPDGLACSILMKDLSAQGRFLDTFQVLEDVEKKGFVLTVDSDIYSVLLLGLCQQMNAMEATKLASLMVGKGIRIDAAHVDDILVHLKGTILMESIAKLCERENER